MNTVSSISQSDCQRNPPTLWGLLFEGPGANPARPVLMAALGLDAASADVLAACTYWRLRMGEPFYKFNAPCGHAMYRAGDSWLEELGLSEHTFYRARSAVATKNTTGHALAATLASTATATLVIYWTDARRVTWYDVRLELLAEKLGRALGIEISSGCAAAPRVGRATATPRATPGDDARAHPPRRGVPMKPRDAGITSLHRDKEEGREEGGERDHTARPSAQARALYGQLRRRGVFEAPARDLARMATARGLSVAQARHAFDRQRAVLAGYRNDDEEVLAMTVARLRRTGYRLGATRTARGGDRLVATFRAQLGTSGAGKTAHGGPPAPCPAPHPTVRVASRSAPLAAQWSACQQALGLSLPRAVYDQHLRGARLVELAGGGCTISVRSPASLAWLDHQLRGRVAGILSQALGRPVEPTFVCEGA